jgi:hypothetical protein
MTTYQECHRQAERAAGFRYADQPLLRRLFILNLALVFLIRSIPHISGWLLVVILRIEQIVLPFVAIVVLFFNLSRWLLIDAPILLWDLLCLLLRILSLVLWRRKIRWLF